MKARATYLVAAIAIAAGLLPMISAAPASADPVVPIIFPVAGPNHFRDDYGEPRSGGRTHGGNDIFGDKLTHEVAAEDGYINWWLHDSGISGNMIEMVGKSGYRYWYIHINNDNPGTDDGQGGDRWAWAPGIEPGAPVRAGQFISYLGDSGNAETTAPHLHFEIHYPDGTRFDPYESLINATHFEEPDPAQGFSFHEFVTVQNPGDIQATVSPRYLVNDGTPPVDGAPVDIPPHARRTIWVNGAVPKKEVSTDLSSTAPVVAERPMYFQYGPNLWTGGHDDLGATTPTTTAYLAEGYTAADFDEYITLGNPGPTPANVDIEYLIRGGGNVSQHIVVPANHRSTAVVKSVVGLDKQVSAVVNSDVPILVERPMYFSYGGWTGGHVTAGVTSPSSTFYFAEGYTGDGFDEYITVANPNSSPANLNFDYLLNSGSPVHTSFTIGAKTRETFNVRDFVGTGKEVSTKLTSDLPVVAERPMYFFYGGWGPLLGPIGGGHAAVGVTAPLTNWLFPEGYTGVGFKEYLTLENPNGSAADVTIEYDGPNGILSTRTLSVPANHRSTVDVNADVGPDQEVAMQVSSTLPIVAERPMYFRYKWIWSGGSVSPGGAAASDRWLFAEGYTA